MLCHLQAHKITYSIYNVNHTHTHTHTYISWMEETGFLNLPTNIQHLYALK
jgi:hypothetical protein